MTSTPTIDGSERTTDADTMPMFSRRALVSFVLGVLAIPFQLFAAVPALALGLSGLREINRSDGRIAGRWLSIAGMVLGAIVLTADLIALGAYALVQLRHKSNRVECEFKLGQIGLASARYMADYKTFPPGTVRNTEIPPDERLSWVVNLLPYFIDLDASRHRTSRENTLYFPIDSGIDRTKGWDAPVNQNETLPIIRALICPGHPGFLEEPGPTYYVGIAGVGTNAASLPASDSNCGFFGYDRLITRSNMQRGESYTMMVCETAFQPGPWARGGFDTVRGVEPTDLPFTGLGRPFGGLHPGITNLLMADASVQPIRDDGLPKTFADMATLRVKGMEVPVR